jgi:DNA repair protein RadC
MKQITAQELKVVAMRECPLPESLALCDTPEKAAEYWRTHVVEHPAFTGEVECFVVLLLNTRRRIKGHVFVATGTVDTVVVHPREVFRAAILAGASAVILAHNHPSGDAAPSEADIRVTRDLIRAGQLLRIEVLDHVILGAARHCSLRELGYSTPTPEGQAAALGCAAQQAQDAPQRVLLPKHAPTETPSFCAGLALKRPPSAVNISRNPRLPLRAGKHDYFMVAFCATRGRRKQQMPSAG